MVELFLFQCVYGECDGGENLLCGGVWFGWKEVIWIFICDKVGCQFVGVLVWMVYQCCEEWYVVLDVVDIIVVKCLVYSIDGYFVGWCMCD